MKKRTLTISGITGFLLAFIFSFTVYTFHAESLWDSVTEGVWQDPVTKDFYFRTVDKEKTSNIYYQTQGFTFADAYKDINGNIVETGGNKEFNWALNNPKNDCTVRELGNGIVETTWTIPYETVMEQIKTTSPEWYNRIMNPSGEVYLKVDAIIAVHDSNKYMGDDIWGYWSGLLTDDGQILGDLWDKYNYEELKDLYGWDPSYFDNHYDQALMIAVGIIDGSITLEDLINMGIDPETAKEILEKNKPPEEEDKADFKKLIGKTVPEFVTYNYSTSGQFDLGDGIPTSEDVTNGYNSDEWYGYAIVCRRKPAVREWKFYGQIKWQEGTGNFYKDKNDVLHEVMVTIHKDYNYTVERSVRYWYVGGAAFYTLASIDTENTVFPDHKSHTYLRQDTTIITCSVNGQDMKTVSQETSYIWVPDDDYHIDWPKDVDSSLIVATGTDQSSAEAAFKDIAEKRVTPSDQIKVRNDSLGVNSHEYMNGQEYRYGEFVSSEGSLRSFYSIEDDDYGLEKDEQTGTIPFDTANGKYFTSIIAHFKQIVLGTDLIVEHKKTPENTSVEERIKEEYISQEPVIVHTPTVSPVIVANPETGEELSDEDQRTQLVTGALNEFADYQLLLDGTYTIKFVPETHFEHIGYDAAELTDDMYNKYCAFKQVAFPFTIQLDGDIHTPDESLVDDKGNPKLAGYTKWIDLPDFRVDDFYIPSWAIEDKDYVILFRVAPENVVDHNGVNHIDDEEWLKNATLNGEPLYNYVSVYSLTVQVSGRIYGFQINGINDKDRFYDTGTNTYQWENFGISSYYPFCRYYEEKRTGIYNRLGGPSVRYSVDGTLTNNWNIRNTLPFSVGRSFKFGTGPSDTTTATDGTLIKGNTFTFMLRTIANLWSEEENADYIVITPTFRYVTKDGTVIDDIDLYYDTESPDGTEQMLLVEYGSNEDRSVYHSTAIGDSRNDGSYYYEDSSISRSIKQDDAEYSKDKRNAYLYEKGISTSKESFTSANRYLMKEVPNYCLSRIVMNCNLRLLTGNLEQLEMNLEKQGDSLEYLTDGKAEGGLYKVTPSSNPEYWDLHRMSMQTWYGEYWIPSQLYVTEDTFMADADGDGVEEEYDSVYEYMEEHGYLEGNEDFFINDGYLVLNFSITTYNEGKGHLAYYAANKDSIDQWTLEGPPDKVVVGDPNIGTDVEIKVRPGDVAVVDLSRDMKDRSYVGFNRIN